MNQRKRLSYGKTLVDLATRQKISGILCLETGMAESKSGLKERVSQIVKQPKMIPATVLVLGLMIGAMIGVTFTSAQRKEVYNESIDKLYESLPKDQPDWFLNEDESGNGEDDLTTEDIWGFSDSWGNGDFWKEEPNENMTLKLENATIYADVKYKSAYNKLNSLDDVTDELVIEGASSYFGTRIMNVSGKKYITSFKEFTGISHYLCIEMKNAGSIKISTDCDVDAKELRIALQMPDDTVKYLDLNSEDIYELPEGKSYVVLCGYKAIGDVNIKFEEE